MLVCKEEPYDTNNSFILDTMIMMLLCYLLVCVRLPKMTGQARKFDENATMSFKANNEQLLKNYNEIWKKLKSY